MEGVIKSSMSVLIVFAIFDYYLLHGAWVRTVLTCQASHTNSVCYLPEVLPEEVVI